MPPKPPVIIVGASARAAAFSALAAGYEPWCADLFADVDLADRCTVTRVTRYPAEFLRLFDDAPQAPWLYTGALENRPALVDRLARRRKLWGTPGTTLRAIRDPFRLHAELRPLGWHMPECRHCDEAPPPGQWLIKPRRSAGGRRIRFFDLPDRLTELGATGGLPTGAKTAGNRWYLQRYVPGESLSAAYVAATGKAQLLGVTRQYLTTSDRGEPFVYAGSVGPWPLPSAQQERLCALGDLLAARFELVGLFGVDLVLDDNGRLCPIELNPRFTASLEVLERAIGFSAIAAHAAACEEDALINPLPPPNRFAGKRILYTPSDVTISRELSDRWLQESQSAGSQPTLADLPAAGTTLRHGQPLLTVLAEGTSLENVNELLDQRSGDVLEAIERNRGRHAKAEERIR